MACPQCQSTTGQIVSETRKSAEGVYRRRQCACCGKKYTTLEQAIASSIPKELNNRKPRKRQEHQSEPQDRPTALNPFEAWAQLKKEQRRERRDHEATV